VWLAIWRSCEASRIDSTSGKYLYLVQRRPSDAGSLGDLRHRHRPQPTVGHQRGRRYRPDRPDRYDLIGASVCLAGMAVIMYAPRGS
jgi:hypothetical protein